MTTDGFKETEIGLIPVDWDVAPLEEVAIDFFGGGTPSTRRAEYWDGDIHWTTSAYIGDSLHLHQGAKFITSLGLENSSTKLVPKDNLLIGTRVGVGKVAINTVNVAISQDLTAAIIDKSKVHLEFLVYAIRADGFQGLVQARTRGTTIKGIPRKDLIKVPIPLPLLPEQRRIADTLRTIQDAIAAQEDLIAAARETKRSLMHRLFTYGPGSEPAPTKETESGEIPEHWEVAQLEESCEFLQYGTSNRCNKDTSGVPVLRIPNVIGGKVDISDLKFIKLPARKASRIKLEIGDLLFVRTNGRREYTGRCAVFKAELPEALFASYLIRVRLKPNTLLPDFVQMYTMTSMGKAYLSGRATGAADGKFNINQQTIKSVVVPVPSLAEQSEIVSTVQSCDVKIAAEEQRKSALEALFRSTLQQLMTGQIRLKP